jgi:hypothetical protein
VNAPFPFIPFDRTSAPSLTFSPWQGEWMKIHKTMKLRSKGTKLFGGQPEDSAEGSVEGSVRTIYLFPLNEMFDIPLSRYSCH